MGAKTPRPSRGPNGARKSAPVLGGKKSAPKLGNARIVPNEEGARSASGRADAPDPCAVGFEGDDEAFRDDRAINPAGCVFSKERCN
jgi:hypothetical protein